MQTVLFYSSVKSKHLFAVQSYYQTDINILQDLGYCVKLSNSISDFLHFKRYDIAFIYFYRYGFFVALLAKIFGKKVYFTGGIDYLDKQFATKQQRAIQHIFFILCNLLSDKSILVSTSDAKNVADLYHGQLPKNCTISFHVIDIIALEFSGNFADKKAQFCTIAWMVKLDNVFRKGIDKAIRIFETIVIQYPEFNFTIAGPEGEGSDYVRHMIHERNLEKSIFLLGSIDDNSKKKLLQESMFYFQLSAYEGFGIAASEALVAGDIVLHSGRGGLKDAVGNFGYKFPDINELSITTFLLDKCKNGITNEHMQDGIEYIKQNFTYEKRLNDFKNIIGLSK